VKYVFSYELPLRRCQWQVKFKKDVHKNVNFLSTVPVLLISWVQNEKVAFLCGLLTEHRLSKVCLKEIK